MNPAEDYSFYQADFPARRNEMLDHARKGEWEEAYMMALVLQARMGHAADYFRKRMEKKVMEGVCG